jgi:hypothetical protein
MQVVLHAEQVRQSLPGGLDIIGVYLFGSGKVRMSKDPVQRRPCIWLRVPILRPFCILTHSCCCADLSWFQVDYAAKLRQLAYAVCRGGE